MVAEDRSGRGLTRGQLVLLVLLAVAAAVSVVRGSQNALAISKDFTMRWASAKLVVAGEDPIAIELGETHSDRLAEWMEDPRVQFYGALPPSSLLVFFPYAPLSADAAIPLWLATNLVALLAFWWLAGSFREQGREPPLELGLLLLLLAGTPFRVTLGNGQLGIVAMAFLLWALRLDDRGRPVAAGAALALSLVKFHLTIPFIFFLFVVEQRWRALAVGAAIHVLAHLAICAVTGVSPIAVWADIAEATRTTAVYGGSLDLPATLGRLGSAGAPLGLALLLGLSLGLTWYWHRRATRISTLEKLAILSFFTLLVPTNRIHDYFCLILPLAWAFGAQHGAAGQSASPGAAPRAAGRLARAGALVCVLYFFIGERVILGVTGSDYGNTQDVEPVWLLSVAALYGSMAVLAAAHFGPASRTGTATR